jgi:hypothetical protein
MNPLDRAYHLDTLSFGKYACLCLRAVVSTDSHTACLSYYYFYVKRILQRYEASILLSVMVSRATRELERCSVKESGTGVHVSHHQSDDDDQSAAVRDSK